MTVAITMPINIAANAVLKRTLKSAAIKEPVQAPVPGRGIPTKSTSPQNPYFSIWSFLLIALFSSHKAIGRNTFTSFIQSSIFLIRSRINGIGRIFPIMQIGIACIIGTLRSAGEAARSPPLNSSIGTMEIIKITAYFEINSERLAVNHCTNASILSPILRFRCLPLRRWIHLPPFLPETAVLVLHCPHPLRRLPFYPP